MEGRGGEKGWAGFCTIVAMDSTSMWYTVCATCERPLPENHNNVAAGGMAPPPCRFCDHNPFNPGASGSKRLYRIFLSIATDKKVMVVVCFDRAARVLLGCSADEFFNFCKVNPFAAEAAVEILEGEIFNMTLNGPKNGNAQHLRVASAVPACSDFHPVIETLRKIYGVSPPISKHGAVSSS